MAKLTFQIDPERLTLDDLIAMEEGLGNRSSRDLLARFLVDATGAYIEYGTAKKLVGSLNLLELKEATSVFVKACQTLAETLIPEASGGN